jgi:hypothetical protein
MSKAGCVKANWHTLLFFGYVDTYSRRLGIGIFLLKNTVLLVYVFFALYLCAVKK